MKIEKRKRRPKEIGHYPNGYCYVVHYEVGKYTRATSCDTEMQALELVTRYRKKTKKGRRYSITLDKRWEEGDYLWREILRQIEGVAA